MINFLKSILFIGFILFLVWNRLIRERSTKDIENIEYDIISIILILTLITFLLILIALSLNSIFSFKFFQKKSKLLQKLSTVVYTYFHSAPELFLSKISAKYNLEPFIRKYLSYFIVYCPYPRLLIISTIFAPSILVATIFMGEILYYHQIHYFYRALPLLFIPLIFRAFIYIIDQVSLASIEYVTAHLVYIGLENNTYELRLAPVSPNIPNALSLSEMKMMFTWLCSSYKIHITIKSFMDRLNDFKNTLKPYIDLYTLSSYLVGWVYCFYLIK